MKSILQHAGRHRRWRTVLLATAAAGALTAAGCTDVKFGDEEAAESTETDVTLAAAPAMTPTPEPAAAPAPTPTPTPTPTPEPTAEATPEAAAAPRTVAAPLEATSLAGALDADLVADLGDLTAFANACESALEDALELSSDVAEGCTALVSSEKNALRDACEFSINNLSNLPADSPLRKTFADNFEAAGCARILAEAPPRIAPAALDTEAAAEDAAPTVADAAAFAARYDKEMSELAEYASRIHWGYATNITYDSHWLVTKVDAEATIKAVDFANEAARFNDLELPADLRRQIDMIKGGLTIPAPSGMSAARELAEVNSRMSRTYSTTKIMFEGKETALDVLEVKMGEVRDPAKLEEMWTKWRDAVVAVPEDGPGLKADYARMVEIANEGARELGYSDVRDLWLSKYDMTSDEMATEVERLWGQVEPLYEELHCHVRAKLNEEYGDEIVPLDQPIRADLLGNMWAQQWSSLYGMVAPEGADIGYDLTALLNEKEYTPKKIVETGEAFFSSLGFEPLPQTFWERSQITKPRDREVVCHASAWNLDDEDDIRIKMCTKVNADDFQTVHHELGHNYYQRAYKEQPYIYKTGAHDGFHEAIGDFVALSITPEYLKQIGLLDESQVPDPSADVGLLMNQALDKIAFLPFGYLMDQWRWKVFNGEITPAQYNEKWWELRERYQGIRPPVARGADAFDPGGKYHIPNNVPYLRYFLSFVMQFQFHKAACEQAGWEGPLHRCSIYGSSEVGERFNAMLEAGASQPWPDTLEKFTGTREMDGSAIIDYFAPLMTYLEEENKDRQCGW